MIRLRCGASVLGAGMPGERLSRLSPVVLVAALAVAMTPAAAEAAATPAAVACSPTRLAARTASFDAAVRARLTVLETLSATASGDTRLTPAHAAAVSARTADDVSGLRTLSSQTTTGATCASLAAAGQVLVRDYRIHALVVPQTHLAVAADTGTRGAQQLAGAQTDLRLLIASLPAGVKRDEIQGVFDHLVIQLATATTTFEPVADTVLALTPAGYPANATVLAAQGRQVSKGVRALAAATTDARRLAALLT